MNTVERRVRAMINPWSTAFARWWCHSAARLTLTGHRPRRRVLHRDQDVVRPAPADAPASGMPQAGRIGVRPPTGRDRWKPNRISSSGHRCPDRFGLDQRA